MIHCAITNDENETIDLTDTEYYSVSSITGLDPPQAQVNTTALVLQDGSKFTSGRMGNRNIVITVVPLKAIEQSRVKLFNFVMPGRHLKMTFVTNLYRLYAEGYVENVEVDHYTNWQKLQLSVLCPDPFLYSETLYEHEWMSSNEAFQFPTRQMPPEDEDGLAIPYDTGVEFSTRYETDTLSIVNSGMETGLTVAVEFTGSASYFRIHNTMTDEYIEIDYTFEYGDLLTITTGELNKSVYVKRKSKIINILNGFKIGSTWLSLRKGTNSFDIDSDGMMFINANISYRTRHLGV